MMLVVLAGAALACGGDSKGPSAKGGSYENKRVRYSFQYPKAWTDISSAIKPAVEGQVDLLDKVALGNQDDKTGVLVGVMVIVVRINHEVAGDALEQELTYTDGLFKQQSEKTAGKLTVDRDAKLGGLAARQYVIEQVVGTKQFAVASTVTYFGDRQYSVVCQGPAEGFDKDVKPGCEQVLNSFRFN